MASRNIEDLDQRIQEKVRTLLSFVIDGYEPFITDGYRSNAEQTKLYDQGRTTPGKIVTYAKAGQSPHNYGLAVDLAWRRPGTNEAKWTLSLYKKLSLEAIKLGFDWGGNWTSFKDNPHMELKNWRNYTNNTTPIGGSMPDKDLEKQIVVLREDLEDCRGEQIKNDERIQSARDERDEVFKTLGTDHVQGAVSAVSGLRSRITDLGNQLGTAQAEVKNREEQVSRLKDQLLTMDGDLKETASRLEEARTRANEFAREKGGLAIQVAQLEKQVESLKKGCTEGGVTLTVRDIIMLIFNQKITIGKK